MESRFGAFKIGLERLLHFMPHLRRFSSSEVELGTAALAALGQVCGRGLRELDIMLGGKRSETAAQAVLLIPFLGLKRLSITIRGMGDTSELSYPDTPTLNMPTLIQLNLTCLVDDALLEILEYVSRGCFPGMRILVLDLPYIGRPPTLSTPCGALLPLFRTVGPQLSTLCLRTPQAPDAAQLLFPLLKKIRKLHLMDGTMPENVVDFLPQRLVELHLGFDLDSWREGHHVVQCLDQLRTTITPRKSLAVICLKSSTAQPVHWWTMATSNSALAGQLMIRAMWLQAQGISLKDQSGKWVGQWS
ncbi:hypothetical protein CALVIDRAFT_537358 [Calocera viscosa TUFC12733]|uniref:F-box domain-containing protein n=1 Tax=Calocera viscosa (strain TUFC12733) TaxID=1330018 RepID=A0A167LYH0_CALVF|nr:hypothetical protein CALVIDRAFT_537358 [Calocera viscosa TUFC12733]